MKKAIPFLLGLAVLGLIISVLLVRIHFQISVDPESKSFCHISDWLDCDAVLASPYAKMGPVFIAELGCGYYILFICGLLLSGGSSKPLSILPFLFIGAVFSFVYSAILNAIFMLKLGVVCLPCLLIPIINLATLGLLSMEMKIPLRELPGVMKQHNLFRFKHLLAPGISVLLIFGMALVLARRLNPQARYSLGISPEKSLKQFYSSSPKDILIPERTALGNPNAGTTIVAFSDFQCPACRRAESVLGPILDEYKDRIRLVYLNYPLNPECNPMASRTKHHLMACVTAREILCAYQFGKFSQYHDWAVKNKVRYQNPSALADELGLDRSSFEKCLDSERTKGLLKEDIETAVGFGVVKSPAIFINGRLFSDWPDMATFRLILDSEMPRGAER